MKAFDLLTIGAGSGGIAATIRAAKQGAKCGLIESDHLGGTCVNTGCVPKKIMWLAADMAQHLKHAPSFGFDPQASSFSWTQLVNRRQQYIERLRRSYLNTLAQHNIVIIQGHGQFMDPKTVMVNNERYTAKHILIATGSKPSLPNFSGANFGIDSDGFFALNTAPKRVAIVGGGYIAVELSSILHCLGIETHFAFRGDTPLRQADQLISEQLLANMSIQGIKTLANALPRSVQRDANGRYQLNFEDDRLLKQVDTIIWAIGRTPNSQNLQLTNAGVRVDKDNYILIDPYQQTNIPHIYAVGDVTAQKALTPVAIAAGRRLADRLFGGKSDLKLDEENIPTAIYSYPPIASIGLSEQQARQQYDPESLRIFTTRFTPMRYALSDKAIPTSCKVIAVGEQEKIIGIHLIGEEADEILQGYAVAMKMGACLQDFRNTIAIHPTSAEELVTIDP